MSTPPSVALPVTAPPPVHDLVGFLAEFAPEPLARLQGLSPDDPALRPGRTLGALSTPLRIRLDVALAALQAMARQADRLAQRQGQRLRHSHRWEFIAQFVALVGSGSVLGAVLGDGSDRLKLAGAVLGLLGCAAALGVKFMRRDLAGAENGLAAQHRELTLAGGSAVELATRLLPYQQSGDDLDATPALNRLIADANTLAGRLYTLMKQAGAPIVTAVLEPSGATGPGPSR